MTAGRETFDELFARFCGTGDAQALGAVFDGTARELLHVALWLCGNRIDAEDVLQRTFLSAIETRGKFARGAAAMPWLMGLLANEARRMRRERARVPLSAPGDRLHDPEGEAAARELAATVRDVAGELAAPYRDVLTLHLEQGCNAKEIAARLQRPAGTVRTQLVRALELLRRRLPTGFVTGVAPFAIESGADAPLAALRAHVLAHAKSAALAPLVATATGGTLMLKKLAVVLPIAALLLGLGVYALWPDNEPPAAPRLPSTVATLAAGDEPAAAPAAAPMHPGAREVVATDGQTVADPGFASVRVTVVWSDDASPAAGVGVYALDESDSELSRRTAVTDGQGGCELRHLLPGPAHIGSSHGMDSPDVVLRAGGDNAVRLRAVRHGVLRGRVVDPGGHPVAEARLWLSDHATWSSGYELGYSAADGTFALPLAGFHYVGARRRGFGESNWLRFDAAHVPGQPIELRLLGAGGAIVGTVRDPLGQPVAWAKILVGSTLAYVLPSSTFDQHWTKPMGQLVVTDEHGDFRADGVAAGAVPLQVWAGEFAPWHGGTVLEADATVRVDVNLSPGAVVTGTVRDATDAPLAAVRVQTGEPADLFRREAKTANDGSYRLAGLPAGLVPLRVQHDRLHANTALQLAVGGNATWDPRLAASRSIRGRVLGDGDRPLADMRVVAGRLPQYDAAVQTDAQGRFALEPTGDGPMQVAVQQDDFDLATLDAVLPGADDLVLRVLADDLPSAHVTLRIVDEAGKPVAARVGPKRSTASQWTLTGTDPKTGTVALGPLPPGDYMLGVDSSLGSVQVPVALAPRQRLDLGDVVLHAPGRATFLVVPVAGLPLIEPRLCLYDERGEFVASVAVEQGRATAEHLQPGRIHVTCFSAGGEAATTIDVPRDGSVQCELSLQRTVPCMLRFRGGWTRQSSARLFAFRQDGSLAAMGGTFGGQPEGRVSLPPGRYRIECRIADGRRKDVDLVVPAIGEAPTLDVELPR